MMKCCFGKRAWIGLGVLAAGLLIAHPHADGVALSRACPPRSKTGRAGRSSRPR